MITGCNQDAVTISRVTTYIRNSAGTPLAKVELRWSPRCKTNWTRSTAVNSTTRDMQAALYRCNTNSATQCTTATGDFFVGGRVIASTVWSSMGYAPGVCSFGVVWLYYSNRTDWTSKSTADACG